MDEQLNSFFAITKSEKQEDGSLMVYGKATDDSVDMDSQICDDNWLKTAMPKWMEWGNIREQHSAIAAGVATEYEQKADGHYIRARVIDPNSVKKVDAGVLKGFSIGIKGARVIKDNIAKNGRIIGGEIIEVSLVDRPANPNAKLTIAKALNGDLTAVEEYKEFKAPLPTEIFKREVSDEERKRLADRGAAMPDGSYPIANVADLKNAIQAFGRAKNPSAVKKHIIRRARALNAVDQLPEDWNITKAIEVLKSIDADVTKFDADTAEVARRAISQLVSDAASEASDDKNDTYSLEQIVQALSCLTNWIWQQEFEEWVESLQQGETMETDKSASAEVVKADETDVPPAVEAPAEETPVVEETAETPAVKEISEESEEAKSATADLEKEVADLRAENESVKEKAAKLETELAEALNKAVAGGPKRTATAPKPETQSDDLFKAWDYKQKADAATDPFTAKGYRELSEKHFKAAGITPLNEQETNA